LQLNLAKQKLANVGAKSLILILASTLTLTSTSTSASTLEIGGVQWDIANFNMYY